MKENEVIYESFDRVKMDTGRRSALFRRDTESTELKGIFWKLKISEDLSATLPLISYLGIRQKGQSAEILRLPEFCIIQKILKALEQV